MPDIVFTAGSKFGVPITYSFGYNGGSVGWGTRLLEIDTYTNSSDPINNNRRISDLSVTFADLDGLIWGSLANGTGGFDKAFTMTAHIGGSMGPIQNGMDYKIGLLATTMSTDYLLHTGNITNVNRKERTVTISSQNIFNKIDKLMWQFPVGTLCGTFLGWVGSQSGFNGPNTFNAMKGSCGFDISNDGGTFSMYLHPVDNGNISWLTYQGTGLYDTSAGTGIEIAKLAGYEFWDTKFHTIYPKVEVECVSSGTIIWPTVADTTKTHFLPSGKMTITGDPVAVLEHMLRGKMVTDYFGSQYIGSKFNTARPITAFQVFSQTIDPGEPEVKSYIFDLTGVSQALFYVNNLNQFEFEPYGPKDLTATLDSLTGTDLNDTSFENDINDHYNRINLKYAWDFDNEKFGIEINGTSADWSVFNDRPYELETKWIQNGNQAEIIKHRQLARFKNTSPRIRFTAPLTKCSMDLGSLVKLTDTDCLMTDKYVQIIEYQKDFGDARNVEFLGLDGDSLFRKRGYAKWEDSAIAVAVAGTSKSGWGTNGTVHNINATLYGTTFVWW